MPRFRFRLKTVLRVRQMREREAQRKLAAKRAEVAHSDRLIAQATDEIFARQSVLREAQEVDRPDPGELARGRAWIAHLRTQIVERTAIRQTQMRAVHELQTELRQARVQTRVLEKLRERRWSEYIRDQRKREQADCDAAAQQLLLIQG